MNAEAKTSSLIGLAFILCVVVAALLYISSFGHRSVAATITSFDECAAAGNPILDSYPEQCRTRDGALFINEHQTAVVASSSSQVTVGEGCAIAGCSKEICTEASDASGIVSSCVYLPQFACFKTARCEKQSDGTCNWTPTAELQACIRSSPMPLVAPMSD